MKFRSTTLVLLDSKKVLISRPMGKVNYSFELSAYMFIHLLFEERNK